MLKEFQEKIQTLTDADLLTLLDMVSDEVKRRNTILGPPSTEVRKEHIQKGIDMLLDTIANVKR